ncbi:MAG: hypothetical protein KJ792_12405 [Actinobacteria bacterium]|nr:hypothetical protein [Actinomycetota bacterium]
MGGCEVVLAAVALVIGLSVARSLQALPADVDGPRQANARQLVVGNCLAELPTDGVVDVVQVVPCGQAHAAQVVGSTQLVGTWPGQAGVDADVADTCRLTPEQARAGDRLVAWAPTRTGWQQGDRTGLCLAVGS